MLQRFEQAWLKLIAKLDLWVEVLVTSLPNVLAALIVFVGAMMLSRRLKAWLLRLGQRTLRNASLAALLVNIGTTVFMIAVIFIVLGILQLNQVLTTALASAGVVGLAIGLALQEPLHNAFSGIVMATRDYYNIGDVVEVAGVLGTITDMTLRSTFITRPTGELVVIPNASITSGNCENYSMAKRRRIDLECGVAYDSDLPKVQATVRRALAEAFEHLEESDVEVHYHAFADSSINFVARYWVPFSTLGAYANDLSRGIIAIKAAFDREGINIPFPIRTLDFGLNAVRVQPPS